MGDQPCLNPDSATPDPACLVQGTLTSLVRQVCETQWLPGVCEMFAHPDPKYLAESDPNPSAPFFQAVGAVHEHSGYSDGDPASAPRDYFRAGRTGHNLADNGSDDTGVILDFMFSSEHSDNEKLPATTSAACIPFSQNFAENPEEILGSDPAALANLLDCSHVQDSHHYYKWLANLEQAVAESTYQVDPASGFTAIRGFEHTNDYYNHLNVYFSTNVVNVKVDGSLLDLNIFWDWLRRPVAEGGGADALVTFNHPGGNPHLSPFDGGLPTGDLLQATKGGANWNDLAFVDAAIDERVVGMEVNGGDDIEWYVKALSKGWHVGPVAAEDEHQREWSTSSDGKTLILTRGRSPQDYYFAFRNRRTAAIRDPLVGGTPGAKAQVPMIHYWTGVAGSTVQTGTPLGSIVRANGEQLLHISLSNLPEPAQVALVSNTGGGQANPIPLGLSAEGVFNATHSVSVPATGEDWYFVVICPASEGENCGKNQNYWGVTAPLWFAAKNTEV